MSDPPYLGPHSVDRTFILTWGVEFIAYTLDIALWGVAMVSVLQYFRKYTRKDSLVTRSTVALLAIFTTVHSVFLAMQNYKELVLLFGNFEGQNVIVYEANVMICAAFLVAFTAQMFYASRIWILSNKDWRYVAPVILLAVLQLSAGIAQTVQVAKAHLNSRLESTVVTATTQGAATLACDVTITTILSRILGKSRTGVRRTDSVLDKMIIYAINRGAMTSLLALLQFVFFIAMPGTFMFTIFILPSSHVYVISVCSMLTSRETLLAELRSRDGIISTFTMPTTQSDLTHNNLANEAITHGVHVSTSVIKWAEGIPADDNDMKNRDAIKIHTV
ncbi:hypothetical protein B0H11DRAFT_1387602 [Mycena galericulata]|nr:hypothetical protein B0H11DRAFT_764923 [Mycena galericulata]KAJ7469964.1 hypothetical protein B0H11DRAFT_1387602 [Mycena galericulata]